MYQQTTLVGNLGSKPELRHTASGTAVASFSLAVNKRWTNSAGEAQDKTTWFRVTCWNKQAEIVSQYLDKGSKVLVVGEIEEAKPWQDKAGEWKASIEITSRQVVFLSSRNGEGATDEGEETPAPKATPKAAQGKSPVQTKKTPVVADIPF